MNVKPHTQTKHREGTLVAFTDLIQELIISNEEERREIISKISKFNATTIGDLYLTSGGRIVLDKGYGEYFDKSDKRLFTLEELKSGISLEEFQKKINNNNSVLSEESE